MNPNIILAGRGPDAVNALAGGARAAGITNQIQRQNALAQTYQQHGPGIMAGDQNALAALSRNDAMLGLGAQSARQTMDFDAEKMQMARVNAARQAQQWAMSLDAQQAAAAQQRIVEGLSGAAYFYQQGDRAGFERHVVTNGLDPAEYTFEGFPAKAMEMTGVYDALKRAQQMSAGPEQTTAMQTLDQRARAAGLQPGTPEYQQFMASGGRGTEIVYGPDGNPIFERGGFQIPQPSSSPEPVGGTTQFENAPDAFGGGAVVRGAINNVADILSGSVPFPKTLEAQSDFKVFGEGLINAFASAYGRQPPSWLLRNIEALTPKPGSIFEGPEAAQSKMRAMKRDLQTRRDALAAAANNERRTSNRADAAAQIAGIDATIQQLDQALGGFGDVKIRPEVADRLKAYQ